ncbi:MAG: hypothetical protein AAB225_01195 [Acidobacteriota bacterium]
MIIVPGEHTASAAALYQAIRIYDAIEEPSTPPYAARLLQWLQELDADTRQATVAEVDKDPEALRRQAVARTEETTHGDPLLEEISALVSRLALP